MGSEAMFDLIESELKDKRMQVKGLERRFADLQNQVQQAKDDAQAEIEKVKQATAAERSRLEAGLPDLRAEYQALVDKVAEAKQMIKFTIEAHETAVALAEQEYREQMSRHKASYDAVIKAISDAKSEYKRFIARIKEVE